MSIRDYDHLLTSADEQIARSIHDEELNVMRETTLTGCAICGVIPRHHDIPGGRDHDWDDAIPDPENMTQFWAENAKTIISPMVRRNLDGAQYAQPRGSQYEGSDW